MSLKARVKKIFLYIFLATLAVFPLLFEKNTLHLLSEQRHEASLAPIGYVEQASGDLRRRAIHSLVWWPVQEQDPVYDRDLLYTGPQTVAKIQILPDTRIRLNENSFIRLERINARTGITLHQGKATATSSSPELLEIHSTEGAKTVQLMEEALPIEDKAPSAQSELLQRWSDAKRPQGKRLHPPTSVEMDALETPAENRISLIIFIYLISLGLAFVDFHKSDPKSGTLNTKT